MKCPNCGNEAQADAVFCDQCGSRLSSPAPIAQAPTPAPLAEPPAPVVSLAAETIVPVAVAAVPAPAQPGVCPKCGASITPGEMFCADCGAPLAGPQPEVQPSPAATEAPVPAPVAAAAAAVSVAPGKLACPDCGAAVAEGDEFCYACGAAMKGVRATPAPTEAAAPVAAPPLAAVVTPPVAPEAAPVESVVAAPPVTPAAVQPVVAAASQPVPAPTPAAPASVCPSCGGKVNPGDTFCAFCGAALTGAAVAPAQTTPVAALPVATASVPAQPAAPVTTARPRLIVATSGAEVPLAAGAETLVGREDPYSGVFPDVDLGPHGAEDGGISRRHFKITLSGGQFVIQDLNSTNGTVVNRQRLQPGASVALADGDEIRAGRIKLIFRVS